MEILGHPFCLMFIPTQWRVRWWGGDWRRPCQCTILWKGKFFIFSSISSSWILICLRFKFWQICQDSWFQPHLLKYGKKSENSSPLHVPQGRIIDRNLTSSGKTRISGLQRKWPITLPKSKKVGKTHLPALFWWSIKLVYISEYIHYFDYSQNDICIGTFIFTKTL